MLTGLHLLLTWRCTYTCPHCFVHAGPTARGTFTRSRMVDVLDQGRALGSVEWIYFEGGEPFLYYPLLLEGLEAARDRGFRTGVVTNAYWAESAEDAEIWLRPLRDLGVEDLTLSEDGYHGEGGDNPGPGNAREAARRLGLEVCTISVPDPEEPDGVRFRGRAADELTEGLPTHAWASFDACPDERLASPGRVHVDAFGHVHLCQGLLLGNLFERPLVELLAGFETSRHPIVGPLLHGGPAELARVAGVTLRSEYVSACHLCYEVRKQLRVRHPALLGPPRAYGEA